ncbi:sensor histidine kinase [Lacrimispora celerecrescens]|uniref:Histidine kinase n=1 Tax=Lacrimispora celerecrescens TaxID=29354 RepID=A0A084JHV0_9FIRM|nr:histidine kinase [Lacrimispora celerecrescens]KEZ88534.1 histidine kinase [Lacrimispora celerecrescens]
MRKRNFIKRFLYYTGIITLPIITVFMIFLAAIVYGKQKDIEAEAIKSAQAVRDSYSLVLDSAATQYDMLVRNPRMSISLRNFIFHKQLGYMDVILTNSIFSNFASLTSNASYISSVYYYLDGYDSILTSYTGGIAQLSQFSDLNWMVSYKTSDKSEWIEKRNMTLYSYSRPTPVLTYYRKLSMFQGVILVNIYEEQLKQLLNSGSNLDQFFIIDSQGNFLLQGNGNMQELGDHDREAIVSMVMASSDQPYQDWISFNHQNYYVRIIPAACGTYIAACISKSNYYLALYTLLFQFLMVLAVVMCTMVWIAYTITKKNFQQIDYFVTVFSNAERGTYNQEKPSFIKDEYDIILNNIVRLFVNQTFLKNQLTLKKQEQKLAEMAALQLQINPHFLFNTLQTLDFKAIEFTGEPTSLNNIIEALSDILKYSLQNTTSMVTIRDEVEYLKKYDSIQRYRYEDKYILYYDYDKAVESYPIMRLILQPLIENSLYHGIKPLPGSGFIKLKIAEKNQWLTITVIDTGVGMSKEEVAALNEKINHPSQENIGLANVNSRLVMQYGNTSQLKILSKKYMGTCISFKIPQNRIVNCKK